jgi:type II secretory pathway pseudopilin PulG
MTANRETDAVRPGQGGFTLIELAVALGVTMIVMLGILALFDFNNKLTRVQTNMADMQQSLRIAQYDIVRMARMTGRGGLSSILPGQNYPVGVGVSILSGANVNDNTYLIPGDQDSPKLLEGSDVLTLRGAFATPIYQVRFADPNSFVLTGPGAPAPASTTGGTIMICSLTPTGSGITQDLSALTALINEARADATKARKEALLLLSPQSDSIYTIVQLDPANSSVFANNPGCLDNGSGVILSFNSDRTDTLVAQYRNLYPAPVAGNLPDGMTRVAFVALLEEHRFYLREDHAVEGDLTSELMPVLARARFYPGTNLPYAGDTANLRQDIADSILDLQFSLGLDTNGDGRVTENLTNPTTDEWLGNAAGDAAIVGGLKAIRISTLARTGRPDNIYRAPDLPRVEDHAFDLGDSSDRVNGTVARMYRRRVLQTIANLRNLTT